MPVVGDISADCKLSAIREGGREPTGKDPSGYGRHEDCIWDKCVCKCHPVVREPKRPRGLNPCEVCGRLTDSKFKVCSSTVACTAEHQHRVREAHKAAKKRDVGAGHGQDIANCLPE